jgi:hypothetical protein
MSDRARLRLTVFAHRTSDEAARRTFWLTPLRLRRHSTGHDQPVLMPRAVPESQNEQEYGQFMRALKQKATGGGLQRR